MPLPIRRLPVSAGAVLALALAALALPGRVLSGQQAAPHGAPWLAADSSARSATVALEVTRPADSPSALINGYREGGVQLVVPSGWTVTWDWRNADSTAAHSLVVMAEREKLPTEGGRAAFTNAMTRAVTDGLPVGATDHTTFEPDQPGWYWMLCGVPGHAIAGEWIGLRVDPEAEGAAVRVRER